MKAHFCYLDANNFNRPYAGQISYNFKGLEYSSFYAQVMLFVHELTHILGFSSNVYDKWVDSNGNIRGINNVIQNITLRGNRSLYITPKLIEIGKKHFNCQTLPGIQIENYGIAGSKRTYGSHFEYSIFNNELMTGLLSFSNAYLSEFTLALLEDTGWYQVNYNYAENFFFGKNKGCNFINFACTMTFSDYCYQRYSHSCTPNGYSKGICENTTMSDSCMMARPSYYDNNNNCRNNKLGSQEMSGETRGPTSKCVIASLIKKPSTSFYNSQINLRCLKYECNANTYQIKFFIGTTDSVICDNSTIGHIKSLANWNGNLTCPNPIEFCDFSLVNCNNYCSGYGICINGNCECRPGHTGVDCSQYVQFGNSVVLKFSYYFIIFMWGFVLFLFIL